MIRKSTISLEAANTNKKATVVDIQKEVMNYYRSCLKSSNHAKKYLLKRISKETIKNFYLGYAPKNNGLLKYCKDAGFNTDILFNLGLLHNAETDHYEMFNNRIVIPIINNGIVVGFGGRALGMQKSKYINSRSNYLYNKSKILYMLDRSKKHIYDKEYAVLVEGYFDVLSLYAVGVKNAVASCGTVFTNAHARLLSRWCSTVVVCLDGDEAGKRSSEKASKLLRDHGIFGGNVVLPDGLDPDEYIKKYNKKAFLEKITCLF